MWYDDNMVPLKGGWYACTRDKDGRKMIFRHDGTWGLPEKSGRSERSWKERAELIAALEKVHGSMGVAIKGDPLNDLKALIEEADK